MGLQDICSCISRAHTAKWGNHYTLTMEATTVSAATVVAHILQIKCVIFHRHYDHCHHQHCRIHSGIYCREGSWSQYFAIWFKVRMNYYGFECCWTGCANEWHIASVLTLLSVLFAANSFLSHSISYFQVVVEVEQRTSGYYMETCLPINRCRCPCRRRRRQFIYPMLSGDNSFNSFVCSFVLIHREEKQ